MDKKQQIQHPSEVDEDDDVGRGFSYTRGDSYREIPGVPKHNGLNVNNDPARVAQKERKAKRKQA